MAKLRIYGRLVRHTKGPFALTDHVSRSPVTRVRVKRNTGRKARVSVWYADGAHGYHDFLNYRTAIDWVRARKSWGLGEPVEDGPDAVEFAPAE